MYSILVIGAGYLGARIARRFHAEKQKVHAVVRTEESRAALAAEGIPATALDLRSGKGLEMLPPAHFIVIALAPEVRGEAAYRSTYLEAVRNFLASRAAMPRPFLIVHISSTSVWRDRAEGVVDETVPPDPDDEKGRILLESERLVLESGFPALVLRLSGIYGPGRNRLAAFREGKWPEPGPDRWMNLIHVDDAALAMKDVFNRGRAGEIYTVTDDHPFLRSEMIHWLAEKTGREALIPPAGTVLGKRLANAKLRALGVTLGYPSFREGYETFLQQDSRKE